MLVIESHINPVAFSLFGIDIYWYAILIVSGILLGAKFAQKEFVRRGLSEDFVYDMLFVVLPSAIIGARLWYVIFEWDYYMQNPWQILNLRGGGLAIHGGIIGGTLALYLFTRNKKITLVDMIDVLTPSLALGQAIGRRGNFVNQEAHGGPSKLPWAIMIDGKSYHPTFLYESLGDFIIFLFLINYRKKNPEKGKVAAIYFIAYGILRFFVEGMRTDSLMIGSFRIAQIVSIVFVIIGLFMFYKSKYNNMPGFGLKRK
ncbi:MAG: prolipoprotein diacylglyceryl transferase [Peptoniphilaceae bacterium]|nr:prolipoprotein diacylglyceryl transferase [Peptoniphilaceae bacterium]MDY6018148.1 prolipoprotein diacylglyceryl transferase [Anaerococcus sp.]